MLTKSAATIPIAIRSHEELGESFEKRVRTQLTRRIGPTTAVERATVRFEDANGPKGGVDTICRIKVVLSGRPSLVVAKRATSEPLAFAEAVQAVGVALTRTAHRPVNRAKAAKAKRRAVSAAATEPSPPKRTARRS